MEINHPIGMEQGAPARASTVMPEAGFSRPSILLIAGDVSGDVHAAALAERLLAHDPNRSLHALGGKRLRQIVSQSPDGKFLANTENLSAIGLISAIRIYFRCRKLRDLLWKFLSRRHVDVAILCDWGGFNGRIISGLHARGIPVLYYFPPGSWQRSGSRSLGIVPYVSRVATPFRWSAERLRTAGVRAEWVGHPAVEERRSAAEREALRQKFGIQPNETLVALLPGSRLTEIRVLAPRLARTARLAHARTPLKFMAAIPGELVAQARACLPDSIRIVSDGAKELLLAADAAIVKTGTGTLEAVLAGTPQIAVYDVSWIGRLEWLLLWSWRWFPFIAMPNIILQRAAVPELIGLKCQPAKIAEALTQIMADKATRDKMLEDYELVRQALGAELPVSPSDRTAQIVEEMLSENSPGVRLQSATV